MRAITAYTYVKGLCHYMSKAAKVSIGISTGVGSQLRSMSCQANGKLTGMTMTTP